MNNTRAMNLEQTCASGIFDHTTNATRLGGMGYGFGCHNQAGNDATPKGLHMLSFESAQPCKRISGELIDLPRKDAKWS